MIFDLDNTIIPWQSNNISTEMIECLYALKTMNLKLCLLSNSYEERVRTIADKLAIPYVAWACKPYPDGFKKAMRLMGLSPGQVAVVGDQLFTDVLGGNLAGAYTILVNPLSTKEFFTTRASRVLERLIFRRNV